MMPDLYMYVHVRIVYRYFACIFKIALVEILQSFSHTPDVVSGWENLLDDEF